MRQISILIGLLAFAASFVAEARPRSAAIREINESLFHLLKLQAEKDASTKRSLASDGTTKAKRHFESTVQKAAEENLITPDEESNLKKHHSWSKQTNLTAPEIVAEAKTLEMIAGATEFGHPQEIPNELIASGQKPITIVKNPDRYDYLLPNGDAQSVKTQKPNQTR